MNTLLGGAVLGVILGLSASTALPVESSRDGQSPPNLVLIFPDDQGYGDLGSYPGKLPISTPNIDRLAHEGVRMTDAYANSPICSASRAGLMTGRYQQRLGFYDNWHAQIGLPEGERIMPAYLREAGYTSAIIGKWHLGHQSWNHPLVMGFDEQFGFLGGQHDYFEADWGASWSWGPFDLSHVEHNGARVDEIDYMTDELTTRAMDFLGENKDNPFFLYLAYNAPHAPLQARESDLMKFAHRDDITIPRMNLLAMIEAMDRGVGQVLDFLDENDLADNTLVIYYNDNGGLHEDNTGFDNWVLNGSKGYLSEAGIRVPALARWPGMIPAGTVYEEPILHMDVLPTFMAAAGLGIPDHIEGKNLLPYWRGEIMEPPHEALFWSMNYDLNGRWAVREGDWKLVDARNLKGLFNLRDDIGETTDLSEEYPQIVERLIHLRDDWNQSNKPSQVTRENQVVGKSELYFRHEFRGPSRDTRQILREMMSQ